MGLQSPNTTFSAELLYSFKISLMVTVLVTPPAPCSGRVTWALSEQNKNQFAPGLATPPVPKAEGSLPEPAAPSSCHRGDAPGSAGPLSSAKTATQHRQKQEDL